MLNSCLIVAQQVGVLFILIAIGFVCNKTRLLKEIAVKGMTDLVLFVVTPCLIVISFQREFEAQLLSGLGMTLVIAIVSNILFIAATHAVVHDSSKRRESVLRFAAVFSNCGYMAIPLQKAILGDIGVFYGAVQIAFFNILVWTYGLYLMGGTKTGSHAGIRKIILNPGLIGCAIGVTFFVTRLRLPELIAKPMTAMADLNTPVPMVIIGYYLAEADMRRVVKDLKAGWVILLRLVVMPLALLALLYVAKLGRPEMAMSCMIVASAPVAAATTMFSAKFEQDTILSVEMVSFSTLLSIITMPLVLGLALKVLS